MKRTSCLTLALSLVFALVQTAAAQAPATDPVLVEIDSGIVHGAASGDVISFKGIPYAAPPVGDLRWRAPQPVKHWRDVRDASKFGPECPQTDNVPKSEDCLTLNVWRPAATTGPLPVMVWIYGGALVHGQTSLYPADGLAAQGVVVVSMKRPSHRQDYAGRDRELVHRIRRMVRRPPARYRSPACPHRDGLN
jgi:para-nitrobenzyl esterase